VGTRKTMAWVHGIPQVYKLGYHTHTPKTCDLKPMGFPVHVTYPNHMLTLKCPPHLPHHHNPNPILPCPLKPGNCPHPLWPYSPRLQVIDSSETCLPDDTTHIAMHYIWKKKDNLAKAMVIQCVKADVVIKVTHAKHTKESWDMFVSKYSQTGPGSIML
jgi:hypothetical protein